MKKLRLPANSRIDVRLGRGAETGQTLIIETLLGKGTAIGAIIFAMFILFVLAGLGSDTLMYLRRHPDDVSQYITVAILAALWLAEFVTMIAVINQTWRKTVLSMGLERVRLTFSSFFGRKQHQWSTREVGAIAVVPTQQDPDGFSLAELQIQIIEQASLRLFIDHRLKDLQELAKIIRAAMTRDGPEQFVS